MTEHNRRLQPWRYVHEVARQLSLHGHQVTIVSDGQDYLPSEELLHGVRVLRVASVRNFHWKPNRQLQSVVQQIRPDHILWNVGLTSFLHQQLWLGDDMPVVGVFTSPIYTSRDMSRLGLGRITSGYRLSAVHLAGAFLPRTMLRRSLSGGRLKQLVVQTSATRQSLLQGGLLGKSITLIPPGVDPAWQAAGHDVACEMRAVLGYKAADHVVLYFGSPAPLRGLHTLLRALKIARQEDPSLKLVILNRRRADELLREDADLRRLLSDTEISTYVNVVSGFLDEEHLVRNVAACDIVALPFELVPSDAPLSLLEAQALGKPVVTTNLVCLPELVAHGPHYLATPSSDNSLARELVRAARDLSTQSGNARVSSKQDLPWAQTRSWEQVGEEWMHFIDSL